MIRPSYRSRNVRDLDPGRVNVKRTRPRRARAMHEFFFENLRNPAHNRRAGLMRQFPTGQVYSVGQAIPNEEKKLFIDRS